MFQVKSKRNKHWFAPTCSDFHRASCSASQSDSYTHQTVILERQTCHTRFKVWSLTWGWLTHRNMNSSLHWGGFKENARLKQIHCMQPLAQCSNSTLITLALSPTDMFTYRHPNINARMHARKHPCKHPCTGKVHKLVRCSTLTSPLRAAQWLQTPMCEACSLWSLSAFFSLTSQPVVIAWL